MTCVEWETKSWGRVWHFNQTRTSWGSYLEMDEAKRCSLHWHAYKENFFALISGLVLIETDQGNTLLNPGGTLVVPAGVPHRFRVIQASRMIELYSPSTAFYSVKQDDITRLDEGGDDDLLEAMLAAGL